MINEPAGVLFQTLDSAAKREKKPQLAPRYRPQIRPPDETRLDSPTSQRRNRSRTPRSRRSASECGKSCQTLPGGARRQIESSLSSLHETTKFRPVQKSLSAQRAT